MDNRKRFGKKKEKLEFDQKLLDLARVARVVKGGRRFSFRATMVIGNRKGKVGVGVAKGPDASVAINKAITEAKKTLLEIHNMTETIPFSIEEKFGAARVLLKPAYRGKGIVAGGAVRAVIELAGIKNLTAKSLGAANKLNVAQATMKALRKLNEMPNYGMKKNIKGVDKRDEKVLKMVKKSVESEKSFLKAKELKAEKTK